LVLSPSPTEIYTLALHDALPISDLRLSDDMIEFLKSRLVDNALLCELATHPDFPRLMADLEIYVNGIAAKQVQGANAIVDAVSRSEEHTSELQSRFDIVCRLLLE